MTWLERGLGLAVAVPILVGAAVVGADRDRGEEVFRFQDPAIVESSGLVVDRGRFVTVNDSGDSGRIFVVDTDGRTVGTTSWGDAVDVEALAPAGRDEVLVGDIGDNLGRRETVQLLRVPYGTGDRTVTPEVYELAYPDGPRDAEGLLVHPRSGRVLVPSKGLMSGTLYEAPSPLSTEGVNELRPVRDIPGLVTGASFLPDGRHLVLRTYGKAIFYSYPDLEVVGEHGLPEQQQGEAIAVDERGEVYVSSEGVQAPVLRIDLPPELEEALAPAPAAGPSGSTPATPTPSADPGPVAADDRVDAQPEEARREVWPWLLGGVVGLLVVVVLVRSLRPR